MRRPLLGLGVGAIAALGVFGAAVPAASAAAACATGERPSTDLVSAPGATVGGARGAGLVEVHPPCGTSGVPQALQLPVPHPGDAFGTSLLRLHLDGDAFEDLVVGVPGLDVAGAADAGGLAVFTGSAAGLRYAATFTKASAGVPGEVQAGDRLGSALSSFDAQFADPAGLFVRVGEPGHDVGAARDAGGFLDLAVVGGRVDGASSRETTLDSVGVAGTAAPGDQLGAALWSAPFGREARVGAPGKAVAGRPGAGAVLTIENQAGATALVTEATAGVPGEPEAGDAFGAALVDRWIGVPGEDVGSAIDAGSLVRYDPDAGALVVTQDSPGIPGTVEAGDRFGASLAEEAFLVDDTAYTSVTLYVGAPGEDLGTVADAGTVTAIGDGYESGPFALGASLGVLQMPTPRTGAAFGAALGIRLDRTQLLVGAPGAETVVAFQKVRRDREPQLPTRTTTWSQTVGTPAAGNRFGAAVEPGL